MSIDPAGRVVRSTASPHSETRRPAPIRTFLHIDDGVTIDSVYDPPSFVYDASRSPTRDLVFVIAHGFTGDVDRPHVRRVVEALTRYGGVVTFSFRGHGASGGRSTVGDREVLDLAAAVAWARELGHARVATVGFSMGGSVVLRHAALYRRGAEGRTDAHPDAVVSVSAPARWYYRGTAPMRRLHWLVTRPSGRLVSRYGFRTRIHHRDWDPVPLSPVEAVPRIAPTPLLIVHGDRDGYFPLDHPRMLAEAAGDHGELWIEPMGHAEHAVGDELLDRIGDWAVTAGG
ncbi:MULTISPECIES: alpha/beta fold hydrolase [Streptomyces]|uniref:Hydrolase n=1 Tax=Streptomyces sviceus (strain ATCC 29083 / DSM 924 / JCM 4929 / NBRC 13980 / NCIMB 11184 / NRRL 5439 / UC 5370) TaxID=463191 RepID=B5HLW2_STRX2|nr:MULTISPECIES: alpha/beta fold hydrolase [Streptomyces]EDY53817.2 hydrolase [Streptomyces sviceus ATCC 29083]MYT06765.1 alpha/beta fold hydrolase [Streptomyces sp. SID5470]